MINPVVVVKIVEGLNVFIPNYSVTPNNPIRFKLSASANTIYNYLCHSVGGNLVAWPKINTIANHVCLTGRTVIRCLNKLEEQGLIIRIRQGVGKPNLYMLVWHQEYRNIIRREVEVVYKNVDELDSEVK